MRRSIVRVAASAAAAVAIAGALAACGDEATAGQPAPAGNADTPRGRGRIGRRRAQQTTWDG